MPTLASLVTSEFVVIAITVNRDMTPTLSSLVAPGE